MSLDQIAVLLDAEAPDRHQVLEAHIADLDRRMEEMRRSREMTEHALAAAPTTSRPVRGSARIVEDLVSTDAGGLPPRSLWTARLTRPSAWGRPVQRSA